MKHGLHHGTHVDVPYHFKDGEKTIEQIPLSQWMGPVLVVDATSEDVCVSEKTLEGFDLSKHSGYCLKQRTLLITIRDQSFMKSLYILIKAYASCCKA